jgi:hypothetical protein
VFTGDAFGLVYPALQRPGPFAFPSTSPTDFDAPEARKSIDRIAGLGVKRAYLTHFGEVTAIPEVAAQLRAWIDLSEAAQDEAAAGDQPLADMTKAIEAKLWAAFDARLALTAADRAMLELDVDLNAQGIAWVAQKKREGKGAG